MRKETINIYDFSDLSPSVQAKVVAHHISGIYYVPNEQEIHDSFNKATELLYQPLQDLRDEHDDLIMEFDDIEPLKGVRLYKWIMNNLSHVWTENKAYAKIEKDSNLMYQYPNGIYSTYDIYAVDHKIRRTSRIFKYDNLENCGLTGVTFDFEAMQNIIDFVKSPDSETTAYDLLNTRKSIDDILEDNYTAETSLEAIKDQLCDTEFLEDGTVWEGGE